MHCNRNSRIPNQLKAKFFLLKDICNVGCLRAWVSLFLFNINMKTLGEIIHKYGMKTHQLYISTPGWAGVAVVRLIKCWKSWMSRWEKQTMTQLYDSTWEFLPPLFSLSPAMSSLIQGKVALLQKELVHNVGSSWIHSYCLISMWQPWLGSLLQGFVLRINRFPFDYCNALYIRLLLKITWKL